MSYSYLSNSLHSQQSYYVPLSQKRAHTDQFLVEMFHNYAFNECISVEKLKLWLLILTKTLFFHHTYKTDIGQHFHKFEKIRQGGATVTKQLIYFSNADNFTTLTPSGSPGVSR